MCESEVVATEFVAGTDKKRYMCELCKISFGFRKSLNSHLKKFHNMQILCQGNQICVLCDQKFSKVSLLHEHLQSDHTISLNFVEETFYLEKDFLDWKNKIEKESLSFYVVRNSITNINSGITLTYYNCHRSGPFKMKQNRIRKVKASGSIKSDGTCPAGLKVSTETVDGISEIKVKWQSVHLGHDLEINTLRLTKEERENLAACLKIGMSMDKILEQARQNPSPTNRYRFLTRKHLHNIRRDFKIPLYNEKTQKASVLPNTNVEASDSSNGCEDCVETEEINHEEIQECEKNSAVSSLLLQQNYNISEQFNAKKMKIFNQLKELHSRIEKWDPQCPLPDVDEHIKSINAWLDISASTSMAANLNFVLATPNKPTIKGRQTKNNLKKSRLN